MPIAATPTMKIVEATRKVLGLAMYDFETYAKHNKGTALRAAKTTRNV